MITYLKGKLAFKKKNFLVLEIGGIGYRVFVPTPLFFESEVGQDLELFVHQHVHEDQIALYGFHSFEDLEFFEMLTSISGIGPKAGLNILSKKDITEIKKAISSGDVTVFTAVTGIGSKKASHIIVELKGKIDPGEALGQILLPSESKEIEEALLSLGYKRREIGEVLKDLPNDIKTPEEKVRWALSKL